MRTRAVRPGFWADEKMGQISTATRLTYIGLWCIADDAGFFVLNVPEIGGALFVHEPKTMREKRVREAIAKLVELGRIRIEWCGIHAVIPKLPDYRYNAGVLIFTVQKKHESCEPATASLGLEIPSPKRVSKASDISPSESSSESSSESESLGMDKATSTPRNGSANGHGEKRIKDPTKERDEAIARARAKLDDPAVSEDVKQAARFALTRLGAA